MSKARHHDFKHIVRLAGTDIDGSLKLPYGLDKIKGVGVMLGYAISRVLGIDPEIRIGYLSEAQLEKIEQVMKNPADYGIPGWLVNRRRSPESGKDEHLIGSDLDYRIKEDVEREKRIRSWRGVRHMLGLKVRGQRTRTTGRKGTAVGVFRKQK